jgi:hypothetical protein
VTQDKPNPLTEKAVNEAGLSMDAFAREERRRAETAAKTARLRAQRLAKEDAERGTDPPKPRKRK